MKCDQCCYYRPPKNGYLLGTCVYPIPQHLTHGVDAFVDNLIEHNCLTFKDVLTKEPPKESGE